MTLDYDNLLNSIMASLDRISQVNVKDIPSIDLYMDQLLSFMDESLHKSVRHPGDDKILTKTMINNYAKNNVLPPPVKKKYSKEHIILLIFIFYYKNILSIHDIQTLLGPLNDRFGNENANTGLKDIYQTIFDEQDDIIKDLKSDIERKYEASMKSFSEADDKDKEDLQMFNFISMLSYDIFMKKLLIENILDHVEEKRNAKDENQGNKKKKK